MNQVVSRPINAVFDSVSNGLSSTVSYIGPSTSTSQWTATRTVSQDVVQKLILVIEPEKQVTKIISKTMYGKSLLNPAVVYTSRCNDDVYSLEYGFLLTYWKYLSKLNGQELKDELAEFAVELRPMITYHLAKEYRCPLKYIKNALNDLFVTAASKRKFTVDLIEFFRQVNAQVQADLEAKRLGEKK